jgi:hypothetical protein
MARMETKKKSWADNRRARSAGRSQGRMGCETVTLAVVGQYAGD